MFLFLIGDLIVPQNHNNSMTFTIFVEDLHDGLNPCELNNTSIVLHCGKTLTRALCMKLTVRSETRDVFYSVLREHNEELIEYGSFASQVLNDDE